MKSVDKVKKSIGAFGLLLAWMTSLAFAGTEEVEIIGFMERGSPCLIIREVSGKIFSLKGVHRSKIEIGKKYAVKGKTLNISNCQQGTTVQIIEIKALK